MLICCLAVLMLGAVLTACNQYEPDHYDYLVTFDYNLGNKISGNAPTAYLGVLASENGRGSLISIRPGFNDSTFKEATVTGYYLEGWYEAELVNGEVQRGDDGRVILKSTPFVFETTYITSDITLYANFEPSPKMLFIDKETGLKVGEIDGRKPGERRSRPSSALAPKKTVDGEPYTFMGEYYADPQCTVPFDFDSFKFGKTDTLVYCEFVKGSWSLVRNARELTSAIGNGLNVYLMNDIDFTGQTFSAANYNGEFNGNGHTIKGIAMSYTGSRAINNKSKSQIGIFQTLLARAYIHDVTFEDVRIDINTASTWESVTGVNVGALAGTVDSGAVVENVKISGVITCDENTFNAVDNGGISLNEFIGQNNSESNIVNCDHSDVKLIYLS